MLAGEAFLLTRVLLQFKDGSSDLRGELSAVAQTPDGSLWLGSDEFVTIERLSPGGSAVFGDHCSFAVGDFIDLFNPEDEIDIEGFDYSNHYLWFTGSHSKKRDKTKGKKAAKDIQRLATVESDRNRYLLARIPLLEGKLLRSVSHPQEPAQLLTAACLQTTTTNNLLIEVLEDDPHLGPFIAADIPSKENGFDIEGLAVAGERIFLGLRGPVFRGWAMLLEVEIQAADANTLILKEIGTNGKRYKKHFVNLNGLGVRELCLAGEDLLILAGPTMDLEGAMQVFRLKHVLDLTEESVTDQDSEDLEVVFNLSFTLGSDHAEGLTLFSCFGEIPALMAVYDAPDQRRLVGEAGVFADVFRL